ncbi:MAG TPA: disulfide bond formation protein B [Acidimicrobiia bacterium]|nr:disulfide bond formation protein B [Acidimicrobiia bacterium]HIL47066.1 disulfide bond formation protein B [Acidimicrobiia bacterium]
MALLVVPSALMTVDQVSLFLSLLALAALGGVVLVLASLGRPLQAILAPQARSLALVVAASSMAGSLYFSEVANYTPCLLCWWQRIAMYPLVIILAVGVWRRINGLAWLVLPFALMGAGTSVYHYQLQAFPEQGSSCSEGASCAFRWVETFGFISIPFMAFCGFSAISALMILDYKFSTTKEAA